MPRLRRSFLLIAPVLAFVTTPVLAQVKEAPREFPLTARADAAAELRAALVAYHNWQVSVARDHARRAVELDSGFAAARAYLSRFDRQNRPQLVEQAMRDGATASTPEVLFILALREAAGGRQGNVAPLFAAASTMAPDDRFIAAEHAMALSGKERIEAFRALTTRFPDFAGAKATLAYLLTVPYTNIPANDMAEAMQNARDAVRLDPANAVSVTALAHVLQRSGKIDEAQQQVDAALALPNVNYYTYSVAAQLSAGKGRFVEARQSLARAQELNVFPVNAAYFERAAALTYARDRDIKAATQALDASAKKAETDGFKANATVNHVFCALLLAGVGDKAAVKHLDEAKRLGGMNQSWMLMDEAYVHALLGNITEARSALDAYAKASTGGTITVESRESTIHSITGMILLAEGKAQDAVAEFKQSENNPWSKFGIAEAYKKLGMKKEMQAQRAAYLAGPDPGLSDASVLPIALTRWNVRVGSD